MILRIHGQRRKSEAEKQRQEELRRSAEAELLHYAQVQGEEALAMQETAMRGLTSEEAEVRHNYYGDNIIVQEKKRSLFARLVAAFINPFSLVLLLVAAVSFMTEVLFSDGSNSWETIIIILSLVLVSGLLQFFQERKSDAAAHALKNMVSNSAMVQRDGVFSEIPMQEIVPGDIVKLSAGDMLPADVRFLATKDLFIAQSSLTGESEPIEKFAQARQEAKSALQADTIGFAGCNVVSGTSSAVVVATGNRTMLGAMAKDLAGDRAKTSFEKGIGDVSRLLMRLMLVLVPVIFAINWIAKKDFAGALLFAMSIAVGITPELLPMIMTTTLAKGAMAMSKRKTIVKNLSSIQSFGAMDILCTDKTGTLTQDHIVLEKYLDIHGNEDSRVLRHAFLNSYYQTGLKNLIDLAIIDRAEHEGGHPWSTLYEKIDEIPFDFVRRRMSVVLRDGAGKRQLITKGAMEEMLSICELVEEGGGVALLTDEIRADVLRVADGLNEQGMRVVAVAQKNDVNDIEAFGVADESDMVLMGFVAFLDPPKESAAQAIEALREHGVRVVVLTGDNEKVARTVLGKVGLLVTGELLGEDVEAMDDAALIAQIETVNLFAKLSPNQKARVVRLMQQMGHTVGYMGDGINDAPALAQADVGISVDSGVDIAKESADIILLEKSLMVLEEGVIEGRKTFGNIIKYIKMAVSGNVGNMISVLVASIFLPFLPMLPIHILAQNLLYDFSQITIPLDNVDEEYLKTPQKWDAGGIKSFMLWMGPTSSIFDIATYLILFFLYKYNTPAMAAYFQTGWFMMGLLTQTVIVHLIRTAKVPFLQSRASWPLAISTIVVGALALIIPYTPLGVALDMARVAYSFIPCVIGVTLAYALLVQLVKKLYIAKHGKWL